MDQKPHEDGTDRVQTILHVDLDAFFAAVEVRDDPSLAGKPVVVGGDPKGGRGRGVVAAASYEARRYGIHSAMPVSQAYRRCPHAVFLKPRGSVYSAASARFMSILRRYSDLVEAISIDEAFVDVTASVRLFGDGKAIAGEIKRVVREEEGLTASIGVAPVKFVAKIASDFEKPDGLVVVPEDGVAAFLDRVGIERLWGAGPKAVERFTRLGVKTIGDVSRIPLQQLASAFGPRTAAHFSRLSRGEDRRVVHARHERKSVGKESTFLEDVTDRRVVEMTLLGLAESVTRSLRKKDLAGQTVTVKLRTADFNTVTRQASLERSANTMEEIWPVAKQLLGKADSSSQAIRLVGVSVSGFVPETQLALFAAPGGEKSKKIAEALDAVADRFGDSAVMRGRTAAAQKRGSTADKGKVR